MKFLKGLLIFIIVIVVIIAVIVGGALVVTSLPSKQIDVEWTEADYQSYLDKSGVVFPDEPASMEDMLSGNFIATGQLPVEGVVSSEELTAVANKALNGNSIMKDIKIKCNDDGTLETSCVIGDLGPIIENFPELEKYQGVLNLIKNKPVYMKSTLTYDKSTGLFEGTTEELYVGIIKIPVNTIMSGLKDAGTAGNNATLDLDGFSVNDFAITGDGFDFDGTIPQSIESAGEMAGF